MTTSIRSITKLLVANRGEPVMRAVRSARRLGITIGVVYAPEDAGQDWIRHVDYALPLDARHASLPPYLDGAQIVAIAVQHHFDAIWPAWGFLAEDAEFAQAVIDAGLLWVGPHPAAIRALGSKVESSAVAHQAGVATVPEMALSMTDMDAAQHELKRHAAQIGYPLLLKPALGGGGQGQVVVRTADELPAALDTVARINAAQFQNGPVLVQRYLEHARHIEAQVLADQQGNLVIFHERDCSIQRRNQKIIEESPSPGFSPSWRLRLQSAARQLATTVQYTSAGTLEFLFDGAALYFLEMNTRLQVEHPVTEATTQWRDAHGQWQALDLLEEMLRVAEGHALRFSQESLQQRGHAIEARLYAEDPAQQFQPSPGVITALTLPYENDVRVDSAFRGPQGCVDPRYDPMIAKVIAWGETRSQALGKLADALQRTTIAGIPTNVPFVQAVLQEASFREGDFTTRYVGAHPATVCGVQQQRGVAVVVAAIACYERDRRRAMTQMMSGQVTNAAAVLAAVPPNGGLYCLQYEQRPCELHVASFAPQHYVVRCGAQVVTCTVPPMSGERVSLFLADGRVVAACATWQDDAVIITVGGERYTYLCRATASSRPVDPHAAPGGGRITKIAVQPQQSVRAGDLLYCIEAMKMESHVCAAFAGHVEAVAVAVGDAVETGRPVVTLQRTASAAAAPVAPPWSADELRLPVDQSPAAAFFCEASTVLHHEFAQACVAAFVQGYDLSLDEARRAVHIVRAALTTGALAHDTGADWLAALVDCYRHLQLLLTEDHAHAAVYFVEHLRRAARPIPRVTEDLLRSCMTVYGLRDLQWCPALEYAVLHALQATIRQRSARHGFMRELITAMAIEGTCRSPALVASMVRMLQSPVVRTHTLHWAVWRELAMRMDPAIVHAAEAPPVAPEYAAHFAHIVVDPLSQLTDEERTAMRAAISRRITEIKRPTLNLSYAAVGGGEVHAEPFATLEPVLARYLSRAFEGSRGIAMPVTAEATQHRVQLFLIQSPTDVTQRRLVAVAHIPAIQLPEASDIYSLPEVEWATIAAFNLIRAYQALGMTLSHNHLCLQLSQMLPITADLVKRISRRIAGFGLGINVSATEVVAQVDSGYHVFEVWHARSVGLLARPPYPVGERKPEWAPSVEADLRQRRLGKLLNTDRVRLLFDGGISEELFFPDADDIGEEPIGLNVYLGKIGGQDSLVYAGDFRFRGGALGDREGRKLAATVVLAYCMQVPLVGIHDGAGANIKGSVSSLGWAGAYFGAIAATGGHSSPEKFRWWLDGHCECTYFEKVLAHFGVPRFRGSEVPKIRDSEVQHRNFGTSEPRNHSFPLIHLHLHLGASVGMLVYGPSISNCALMVDHPEVYRLLTGAATVERVTGEKGTNYDLGGALVHGGISGEIDMVLGDEPAVIAKARALLACFRQRVAKPAEKSAIQRSPQFPQPTIPVSGGIIVGRDAICANIDRGEFFETRRALAQAGGLLTGYAQLGDQPVTLAVTATDYGLHHGRAFKKMQLAAAAAEDFGLPLIVIAGANWNRLEPPVRVETIYQLHEMRRAIRTARVPRVSVIMGPRSLERDIHEMMDLRCYVPRGNETPYELSRARLLCHAVVDSLALAFDWCADILRYVPRPWELPVRGSKCEVRDCCAIRLLPSDDPLNRLTPELAQLLPATLSQPYDIRRVIEVVLDRDSFREFSAGDEQPLVVGVATLGGRVVGIIADQPQIEGGAQTVFSISKFTRFHRFCERFGLPIIEFNDSPAFRPGREQERGGIQGEGGKSIREEVLSTIPKIAVTLRQNYGGRYIHANMKTLGPPRAGIIMQGARLGVMGAEGAVGVLHAKKLAALADPAERDAARKAAIAEYETHQLNPQQAVDLGYAEAIIAPDQLRSAIGRLL